MCFFSRILKTAIDLICLDLFIGGKKDRTSNRLTENWKTDGCNQQRKADVLSRQTLARE